MATLEKEFWKKKNLEELNKEEWEAICSGCGKCCVHKIGSRTKSLFTNIRCRYLELPSCRCSIYYRRYNNPECGEVTFSFVKTHPELLPSTCAYKLLVNGQDLPDWHPLISGNPDSVRDAQQTIASYRLVSEESYNFLRWRLLKGVTS